jgi:hypothetical protein
MAKQIHFGTGWFVSYFTTGYSAWYRMGGGYRLEGLSKTTRNKETNKKKETSAKNADIRTG